MNGNPEVTTELANKYTAGCAEAATLLLKALFIECYEPARRTVAKEFNSKVESELVVNAVGLAIEYFLKRGPKYSAKKRGEPRTIKIYNDRAHFKRTFIRAVINKAKDILRKQRSLPPVSLSDSPEPVAITRDVLDKSIDNESFTELQDFVENTLTTLDQEVFRYTYTNKHGGLTEKEIFDNLTDQEEFKNITRNAIKQSRARIMAALTEQYN